jgi:sugar phosphate isomerase/epimerase
VKLAVSTYSLWAWMRAHGKSIDEAVGQIAEFGVDGVEFAGFDPGRTEPSSIKTAGRLRKRAEKAGLAMAGYCVPGELLMAPAKQREQVEKLKHEVDVAAELGVKSMRHDVTRGYGDWSAGVAGPRTFENAVQTIVPAIREIADYAATKRLKTSLENHGFYMQAAERVEQLLAAVDHANFALTLDMGNFLCVEDDPVAAVHRLAKYAVMVHAKDFHVRPKESMPPSGWFATPGKTALRGAIVGHGVIDVAAQVRLLKESEYDGFLSLEFEGLEDPIVAVKLGLEYVRKLL